MKQRTLFRITSGVRINKYFKYQAILALLFVALFITDKSRAEDCPNVVISELQITGGTGKTNEDFIELLNAGNQSCNLKGHRLVKRTEKGVFDNLIYEWKKDAVVLPWRYYLWVNDGFSPMFEADVSSEGMISNDNGIALRYDEKIIDALGWGSSKNIYSEKYIFAKNPGANQSIERRLDNDFFLQTKPNPKNSSFLFEQEDEKFSCENISFSEIFPFGNEEYVEIKNNEDHECDLSNWKIKDTAGHRIVFPIDLEVRSENLFVLKGDLYLNDDGKEEIFLLNTRDKEIDKREYSVDFKTQNKSYSYFEDGWFWTNSITPGKENEFLEDEKENEVIRIEGLSDYAGKILINEFLPSPRKDEDEFIELYNASEKQEDIFGWVLHDATKSGQYVFKEHVLLAPKEFFVIVGDVFKFALNSTKEKLALRDDKGKIVSMVSYDKSKSGSSYNWNGSFWRWSKFLTPGKVNIFNNEPYGKIKLPKDVWENVYADFSVLTGDKDGEKVKIVWDFGDGHKSYLAKARHKYEKEGEYEASLKLSDDSEDIIKNFKIKVEEMPHPKVRITLINPNPQGSDTLNETITVENRSKKKINLNGWSIATGWKKFINHPIGNDIEIGKNKSKEISRELSSFTLNNKKDRIELRYPDGEVAYEVKYKKEEGIEEGEIYKKVKGGWEWDLSQKSIRSVKSIEQQQEENLLITKSIEIKDESSVISNQSFAAKSSVISNQSLDTESSVIGNQSSGNDNQELEKEIKKELDIEILKNHSDIEILDEVKSLKNINIREEDGKYFLTLKTPEQEHYAIAFAKEISSELNEKINVLLNDLMN